MSDLIPQTFDDALQTHDIKILKTVIPFLDAKQQEQISCLILFLEFQQTQKLFLNPSKSICSCELQEGENKRSAMLSALKECCTQKEQETLDTIINFLCIMDNYELFVKK